MKNNNDHLEIFRPNINKDLEPNGFIYEQLSLNLNLASYKYPDKVYQGLDSVTRELSRINDLSNIAYPPNRKKANDLITGEIIFSETAEQVFRDKVPQLTNKDMLVLSGITALWHQGERHVTPKQIYRMATKQTKARVTAKQEEETIEIIELLSSMRVTLDVTAEYRGIKKLPLPKGKESIKLTGNLLNTTKLEVYQEERGNQKAYTYTAYKILEAPLLYHYAVNVLTNAYTEIDLKQLSIGSGFEDGMLNNYLSRMITLMRNPNNNYKNRRISFEEIYKHVDLDNPSRKQRARIKDKVEQTLNNWVSIGQIKSFTLEREGKSKYPNTSKDARPYKSVLIHLNENKSYKK